MNFLKNLDALLESQNLSRAELGRRLNIAPSTINSWYSKGCDNVSLRFIVKIAEYFNVTIDDLVNGTIIIDKSEDIDMEIIQSFCRYYRTYQKNLKKKGKK